MSITPRSCRRRRWRVPIVSGGVNGVAAEGNFVLVLLFGKLVNRISKFSVVLKSWYFR